MNAYGCRRHARGAVQHAQVDYRKDKQRARFFAGRRRVVADDGGLHASTTSDSESRCHSSSNARKSVTDCNRYTSTRFSSNHPCRNCWHFGSDGTYPEPDSNPRTDSHTVIVPYRNANTDSYADVDSDRYRNRYSNRHCHLHANLYTHSDCDTFPYCDQHADA